MKQATTTVQRLKRLFAKTSSAAIAGLSLLLAGPAFAQAPTWQSVFSGNNNQPNGGTSQMRGSVTDASGNIIVVGSFTGQIAFGNTKLSSAGSTDAFVAKWNPAAATWVWAGSGGGTGADVATGVAVSGNNIYFAGTFTSGTAARFGNVVLAGAGNTDGFLVKLTDGGNTANTRWAVSGGGTGADVVSGVAASGSQVYVVGTFPATTPATFAGSTLTSAGTTDAFVAKYTDNGGSAGNGWAVSGGGTGDDQGYAVAARDSAVFITGYFSAGSNARFAGTAVTGPGLRDVFVAKYFDRTNHAANAWVSTGGARAYDEGKGLAVNGNNVYVTGYLQSAGSFNVATIAGVTLTNGPGQEDAFVAKIVDNGLSTGPGWAAIGGGPTVDSGYAVAVNGNEVYMTGAFNSNTNGGGASTASMAGVTLLSVGGQDAFVAKYTDNGSTFTDNWASAGGGGTGPGAGIPAPGNDYGYGLAVSNGLVYAAIAGGTAAGRYGSRYGTPAPYNGAILAPLNAATGVWQPLQWPLQGTVSRTLGTAVDASGNVFVTGSFTGTVGFGNIQLASVGLNDMYVAKWQASTGTWAWATSGGGLSDDVGNGIAVNNGSVYVAGSFTSGNYRQISIGDSLFTGVGNKEIFLTKFIDNGNAFTRAWTVTGNSTSDDEAMGVAVNGPNVYLTGYIATGNRGRNLAGTNPTSIGGFDAFLAKYVDNGATVSNGWALAAGGVNDDQAYGVAVRGTSVYITGKFQSNSSAVFGGVPLAGTGTSDMFLAKYIDNGTNPSVGGGVYGGGGSFDYGYAVAVNGPNVYVTGYFGGPARFSGVNLAGAGSYDMFLAKYVDTGNSLANGWAVSGGGTGSDAGHDLAVNGSGIYVTGSAGVTATIAGTALGTTSTDVFLARYTELGTSARGEWAMSGGGTSLDVGQAVAVRGANVYVAGFVTPGATFGPIQLPNPTGGMEINFLSAVADPVPLLGTTAGQAGLSVQLYPNPAHTSCTIVVPANLGKGELKLTLLDGMGRIVRTQVAVLSAADLSLQLETIGFPPGIYNVQLTTSTTTIAKKLVLQ